MAIQYRITTIDVPGSVSSSAEKVNDKGQVTGAWGGGRFLYSAFVYANGTARVIQIGSGAYTGFAGVTETGTAFGNYSTSGGTAGFTYSFATGKIATVSPAGASTDHISAMNNRGQIAGGFTDAKGSHAFLYANGHYARIDVTGATFTDASLLNDRGELIGTYIDAAHADRAFADIGGRIVKIVPPNQATTPYFETIQPVAINEAGDVVGNYTDSSGRQHGFLFAQDRTVAIDAPGATSTEIVGVNDCGEIVGTAVSASDTQSAFVDQHGHFSTLSVPGAIAEQAVGIDDRGEVVGNYQTPNSAGGFVWEDGRLSTITVPGHSAALRGISDTGEVVGSYSTYGPFEQAFLARPV